MSFKDKWKKWSTPKKALFILVICCIGLIIIGAIVSGFSPDKNTSSTTNTSDEMDTLQNEAEEDSEFQIKIITNGSWSGSIGNNREIITCDGTGNDIINVNATSSDRISASVQKQSSDSSKLTVQIIQGGTVIKESSTTAEKGIVSITN